MTNPMPPPACLILPPAPSSRTPPWMGTTSTLSPSSQTSVTDGTAVGTEATVAISECHHNHLKACIIAMSTSVWGIQDIFPPQLNAVYPLLHPQRPNHLVAIHQNGAGKTHNLWTMGVIEWGIVLIFIPLLTLSADVMSKFMCTIVPLGAVIIQHLNELYDANKNAYKKLLQRCGGLLWSSTMTVFIFLSPQFLINHPDACNVFIECLHCTTLWVVALDEAHIHVQHRTLFCNEICALQAIFFSKIFWKQSRNEMTTSHCTHGNNAQWLPTNTLQSPDNQFFHQQLSCLRFTY